MPRKAGMGRFCLSATTSPLRKTEYGKVRGYVLRGIYYFLGMPYGADTSGPNRFMPPQKPKPWTDVYPALWWGNSAPQNMENRYENKFASFRDHWNYDDVSEDCLRINVFTPAINDGKKRPVLFWIHGGGFTNGNGIEQDGYNGENFARLGDVVFCSINHRLGPLGYLQSCGRGRREIRRVRKRRHAGHCGRASSGFATTSPTSAAIRETSPSWGNRAAARKSAS